MSDDQWEGQLWGERARGAFLDCGEIALSALAAHLAVVGAARSPDDEPAIEESSETVRKAFLALSDAEFDYATTIGPFGLLSKATDDESGSVVDSEESDDVSAISVFLRRDFKVESHAELLKAGARAHAEIWDGFSDALDSPEEQDAAQAILNLVHSGGVAVLEHMPGLTCTGSVSVVVDGSGAEPSPVDDVDLTTKDLQQVFQFESDCVMQLHTESF